MGIWDGAVATRSWLHSTRIKKSFGWLKKNVNWNEIFYLDDTRNAQNWQWDSNWRHKKLNLNDWKCTVPRNVVLLLYNCLVLVEFLGIIFHYLWNLSARLCEGCPWLLKIEKFLDKMAISFSDWSSQTTKSYFPCQLNGLSAQFLLFSIILG